MKVVTSCRWVYTSLLFIVVVVVFIVVVVVVYLYAVVNYEFVNTTPEITVVEGESVTLQSGLNPMVSLDNRELQLFMIRTESGSALGK